MRIEKTLRVNRIITLILPQEQKDFPEILLQLQNKQLRC